MSDSHRDSIYVCDCLIKAQIEYPQKQYIITLHSEEITKKIKPGQFIHIKVSDEIAMRRPISIMSVDYKNNTFDILYKIVGTGTLELSKRKTDKYISVIGPIGNGFNILNNKKIPLMIGGGVGIPPIIAIAQNLKHNNNYKPFAVLGSEVPFPFAVKPAIKNSIYYDGANYTMALLENWNIECRLASTQEYNGVYKGYVTDLAQKYLENFNKKDLQKVAIYACGPNAMLEAVAKLAFKFNLPCQVCLEEFMACAVGGCAGCTVMVKTDKGEQMQRVCVDGPVFEANTVF